MKEFMKAWIIAFIRLFGVLISIATIAGIFFGVIYWLDKFGVYRYRYLGFDLGICNCNLFRLF